MLVFLYMPFSKYVYEFWVWEIKEKRHVHSLTAPKADDAPRHEQYHDRGALLLLPLNIRTNTPAAGGKRNFYYVTLLQASRESSSCQVSNGCQ